MKGYKKLQIYQKSKQLVVQVYEITSNFPKSEIYIMIPQMKRSAISVVANIVEGYSKESTKEYCRFLTISIGSLTELEVYLELSFDLGYIDIAKLDKINLLELEVKRLLYGSRKKAREKLK